MVTPAIKTTAVLLVFKLDKFKIIITLHWEHKFGDTGPYKNLNFLFDRLRPAIFLAKLFFTMFPCGNCRTITVKQIYLAILWLSLTTFAYHMYFMKRLLKVIVSLNEIIFLWQICVEISHFKKIADE